MPPTHVLELGVFYLLFDMQKYLCAKGKMGEIILKKLFQEYSKLQSAILAVGWIILY